MEKNKTVVFTLGGTIEAIYSPEEGTPYNVPLPKEIKDSAIPEALNRAGAVDNCAIHHLAMLDSKQISAATLDNIVAFVAFHEATNIIIVQGTDTMPIHARYLSRRLLEYGTQNDMHEKKIIFTGSMSPLRDKSRQWREESDGWKNIKSAIENVKSAHSGVYIDMGKGLWPANEIDKHVETKDSPTGKVVTSSGFEHVPPDRFIEHTF